jgi:hypothetical protein
MERRSHRFWNRSRMFLNRAERIRASRSPVKPLPPRKIYGNYPFTPRVMVQKRQPKLHEIILSHIPDWDLTFLLDYLPTREQLKIPYMVMAALPIMALAVALLFFFPQNGVKTVSGKLSASGNASDPVEQAEKIAGENAVEGAHRNFTIGLRPARRRRLLPHRCCYAGVGGFGNQ